MKQSAFLFLCLALAGALRAQSKLFKEVGAGISTQVKPILQDNSLVGYLAFTRLEEANTDSFNYRVAIMDENLHDIGKVDFRQAILRTPEGGYQLYVYSAKGLDAETNFELRDGYDNPLKVLAFDNDPATGDPFIAGCIINPRREKQFFTANDYSYSPYLGLFTLELGNPHKEMHANCSYWSNQNFPGIGEDGMFTDKEFYVRYAIAFRDYKGNTLFAGTALVGKGYVGAATYKFTDGVFARQEESGTVALDNNIPCDVSKSFGSSGILPELDKKDYHSVVDPDSKSNYVIIDDEVNIYIYNANTRKVVRTIPHKAGHIKINVFPAKEGHIMVAEFNGKEKYTRYSIEAL